MDHYERRERPDRWPWSSASMTEMASAWNDWAEEMADVFDNLVGTVTERRPRRPGRQHHKRRHRRPARCGECVPDSCHCDCCVYDADLVVYTRVGEQRVVPIRISNERTRTRHITLELSEFTTSGGSPAPVAGKIVTPTEFDLEACERQDAVVVINVGWMSGATATIVSEREAVINSMVEMPPAAEATDQPDDEGRRRLRDVDDCVVAYADLRIQGCDVRPVRIAVAILPRDCDAYEVHCACGCC